MAGTGRVNFVRGNEKFSVSENKAKALVDCPRVSQAIVIGGVATGSVIQAMTIPAGAYVTRVCALCTTAVASADFNVGDGAATTRYLNGITTMRAGDMICSQVAGAVSSDMVAGHYYASEDTIDVRRIATATTGTIKLLVWYTYLT
jgi:hypothetical protein